jgi:hypothetical protein
MKRAGPAVFSTLLVALVLGPLAVAGGYRYGHRRAPEKTGAGRAILGLPAGELDETETADLLHMREEEKLARDVYIALAEKWQLRIFRNIAKSEQKHMDALLLLLDKYGIEDPVGDNAVGTFTDADLQSLYTRLVATGQESEVDALRVGATIEDLDIADLQAALGRTDEEDVTLVYEHLMQGSRNHLRAFVRQLEKRDETYTPQSISQEDYDAIVDSKRERWNWRKRIRHQNRNGGGGSR